MKWLAEVLLICCVVVSSTRSMEDVMPTLETENEPTTISVLNVTSTTETTVETTMPDLPDEEEKHKPSQLPVDLLSSDKILLDPNVVLARVVRDTYAGWGDQRQSFPKPYERRPFGIQGYYNPERSPRPVRLIRRNDVRKTSQLVVTPKRFRIYPVFPG